MRKFWLASFLAFCFVVFGTSYTFAEGQEVQTRENLRLDLASPSSSPAARVQNRENIRNEIRIRLEGAKLQACKAREGAIKNRKESLLRLVTSELKKMDGWFERLRMFYENRVLSAGKKVDNYDELLASVETARGKLTSSLDKASTLSSEFSCDGDNPKQVYTEFRQTMQETKTNMFEYRKAIKNLLVAIRRAAVGLSASPSPLTSPEAE
ncbi:MAG: hypothetical protein KatS3mg088_402 [Patescibacteria group bacterium]|nr:MAG: hypothetical protein KatS3mg088_402 [Patescibacteria group bacterium]